MLRIAALLLGVVALLTSVVGTAASLGLTSNRLAAGDAAVTTCGSTSGAKVEYTITSGNVTTVQVSGLPATCNGGDLKVTLVNSSGAAVGAGGPTAVSAGTATVSLSPAPASSTVATAHFIIEGP